MGHARRWSWVLVLLVGGALFEVVRRAIVSTGNPNLVPALILLGAAVVPAAFVTWDLSGSTAAYLVLAVISLVLLAVTSHRLAAPHRRHLLGQRAAVPA
jgi:hypothetical protein